MGNINNTKQNSNSEQGPMFRTILRSY